jgi:hypothetical protein
MRRWVALLVIAACSKPQPKLLATIHGDVQSLAVDDAYVYVATMDLGKPSIGRVPKDGGDVETIVAKTSVVSGLTVDGGKLYWSEIAMNDEPGASSTFVSGDDIEKYGGIGAAVSAGVRHSGRVMSAPASGGAATELGHFEGTPGDLALDDASIFVLSIGAWPLGGEIDVTQGALIEMPKAGGPVTVLVDHVNKPRGLVVDGASVYWSASDGAWKVAKSGGSPEHATAPATNRTDDAFEHAIVVGKTRYHAVNKDFTSTLRAEAWPAK